MISENIAKLASIYLLGNIFGKVLNYLINIVISNALGSEALGIFAFGLVVLQLGALVSRMGLDKAAQKFIPEYQENDAHQSLNGLIRLCILIPLTIGSILAILGFSLRNILAQYVSTELVVNIGPLLLAVPFMASMIVLADVTRGFKETKYYVYIRNIGQTGAAFIFIIIGSYIFKSLSVTLVGYFLSTILGFALAVYFVFKYSERSQEDEIQYDLRKILTFSLPFIGISAVSMLASRIDILMLGSLSTSQAVGWYQVAFATSLLLTVVLDGATAIFPSLVSGLYARREMEELELLYTAITKWATTLTALGLCLLWAHTEVILRLFGLEARIVTLMLLILSIAQAATVSVGPAAQLLSMTEYERLILIDTILMLVINAILNYFLIQRFGVIGAAAATAISLIAINVLQLAQVQYYLNMHPYNQNYWKPMLAVITSVLSIIFVEGLELSDFISVIATSGVALLIFSAMVFVLGLDEEDSRILGAFMETEPTE